MHPQGHQDFCLRMTILKTSSRSPAFTLAPQLLIATNSVIHSVPPGNVVAYPATENCQHWPMALRLQWFKPVMDVLDQKATRSQSESLQRSWDQYLEKGLHAVLILGTTGVTVVGSTGIYILYLTVYYIVHLSFIQGTQGRLTHTYFILAVNLCGRLGWEIVMA